MRIPALLIGQCLSECTSDRAANQPAVWHLEVERSGFRPAAQLAPALNLSQLLPYGANPALHWVFFHIDDLDGLCPDEVDPLLYPGRLVA